MPRWLICAFITLFFLFLQGCAGKQQIPDLEKETKLAVAEFEQPQQNWQLLAGYLPQTGLVADQEIFQDLDAWLMQEVQASWEGQIASPLFTKQCKEIVLFEEKVKNLSALKFWTLVGRCVPARYLLVPQLFAWKERQGGQWGVKEPAGVVLDLYLIDVQKAEILKRFHADKEQESLTANLLNFKSFYKHKGRWVKAEQLAREVIAQGVEELGL